MPRNKAREYYLKRTYGITERQYTSLLKQQEQACAICLKPAPQEKRRLSVDHNHTTGEIRGLLCFLCNRRLIGRHKDPWLFSQAAKYLSQGTGWFVPEKKKKKKRKKRS